MNKLKKNDQCQCELPDKTLTQRRKTETHTHLMCQLGLTKLEETACDGNYCVLLWEVSSFGSYF